MSETKHTPTARPWIAEPEPDSNKGFMVIAKDASEYANEGDLRVVASYLLEADARLICLAVNSHDELLEACTFALETIERHLPELHDGSMAMKLRAAIQKAGH